MLQRQASKPSHKPGVGWDKQQVSETISEREPWPESQRGIGNQAAARMLRRRSADLPAAHAPAWAPMSAAAPLWSSAILPLRSTGAPLMMLQRKCACGGGDAGPTGECEECSKKPRVGLQTKLLINEPGDIYEQEADRVADQAIAMSTHPGISSVPPRIQRLSGQLNGQTGAAPPSVDRALASPGRYKPAPASVDHVLASAGRPLDPPLRHHMEQRFGHDFSSVRVHTDAAAAESAQAVGALAYTVGENVVFGRGQYAPQGEHGLRLMAHELAHVLQQRDGAGRCVQRTLAGCQNLLANPGVVGLVKGRIVHALVGRHFRATVPGARGVMIPGAYASPLRTAGLCGADDKVIDPQEIGGMDPHAGAGLPDLARLTSGGILQVAEMKPAVLPCLVDGEEQALRYIEHGNARDEAATTWRASLGVRVVSPMMENVYPPPTLQVSGGGASAQVKTAWCTPGLLAYTVNVTLPPPFVPVPEPEPVKEYAPARAQRTVRLPSGIDWGKVVGVLGLVVTLLALTPWGRIGEAIGAAIGLLLRWLGFALAISGGAAAASAGARPGKGGASGQRVALGQGAAAPSSPPVSVTVAPAASSPSQTTVAPEREPPSTAAVSVLNAPAKAQTFEVALIEGFSAERGSTGMLRAVWLSEHGKPDEKLFAVLQVTKKAAEKNKTTVEFKSLLENKSGRNTLGGNIYILTSPYRASDKPALTGYVTFTGGSPQSQVFTEYLEVLASELEVAGRKVESDEVRKEVQRMKRLTEEVNR